MTQHRWSTTDGWDILAGYDRAPRDHYFIDISRDCATCNGNGFIGDDEPSEENECSVCGGEGIEYLFNNLDSAQSEGLTDRMGNMTLTQLHMALKRHLTEWPVEFLEAVREDLHRQADPYVRHYDNIGQAITIRPVQ